MIMVDDLRIWPHAKHECFKRGSAHLTSDGPRALWDLHVFAKKLGLKRSWFQDHPLAPHYDLSPSMHAKALAAGATLVPAREQARRRIEAREASKADEWLRGVIEEHELELNQVDRDALAEMFPDWSNEWSIKPDAERGHIEAWGLREQSNFIFGFVEEEMI